MTHTTQRPPWAGGVAWWVSGEAHVYVSSSLHCSSTCLTRARKRVAPSPSTTHPVRETMPRISPKQLHTHMTPVW